MSSWRATWRCGLFVALAALAPASCKKDSAEQAHEHGHDHGKAEEEPITCTRWSDDFELFVELEPPKPNQPVRYHAHLTRLDGFAPVDAGRLVVRYERDKASVREVSIDGVARPGIFTPEGPAPGEGNYELTFLYEHQGKRAQFSCGPIAVPAAAGRGGAAGVTFLKEAQWKIPFSTAWATERPIAREVELAALVEPAATEQLTIGAPTGGRFFYSDKIALAPGQRIEKGTELGRIAPTVAGEDFGRLELDLDAARIEKERIDREIARVKPLVEQGLLPERRSAELDAQRAQSEAALSSARRRVGRVLAPAGRGGVAIRAALAGIVSEVLVPNGEPVAAGATLVRLRGSGELWLRARFVATPEGELADARPAAVRLPRGQRVALGERASFLSGAPIVDPETRLATWIARVPPEAEGEPRIAASLRIGESVVLAVRVGKPRNVIAVPHEAVVEIDTRPYVFVQTEGELFEKRRVEVGERDGDYVEIRSGIEAGERIVTKNGFDIHLASLVGSVESHRH